MSQREEGYGKIKLQHFHCHFEVLLHETVYLYKFHTFVRCYMAALGRHTCFHKGIYTAVLYINRAVKNFFNNLMIKPTGIY